MDHAPRQSEYALLTRTTVQDSRWVGHYFTASLKSVKEYYSTLRQIQRKVLWCAFISAYFTWRWSDELYTLDCMLKEPWRVNGPRNCVHKFAGILLMLWTGIWCVWLLLTWANPSEEQPDFHGQFEEGQDHMRSAHEDALASLKKTSEIELEFLKTMAESNKVLQVQVLQKLRSCGDEDGANQIEELFVEGLNEPADFVNAHISAWREWLDNEKAKVGNPEQTWCGPKSEIHRGSQRVCTTFKRVENLEDPEKSVVEPIDRIIKHMEETRKGEFHKYGLGNGWLSWGKLPEGKETETSRHEKTKSAQQSDIDVESKVASGADAKCTQKENHDHGCLVRAGDCFLKSGDCLRKISCDCCTLCCWIRNTPSDTSWFPMQYSFGCCRKYMCWMRLHSWSHFFFIANGIWIMFWIKYYVHEMILLYRDLILNDPFDKEHSCRPLESETIEEIHCTWAMLRYVLCIILFLVYLWCWFGILRSFNLINADVMVYQQTLAIDLFEDNAEDLADLISESKSMTATMQKIQKHWNSRTRALAEAVRTKDQSSNSFATGDFKGLETKLKELRAEAKADIKQHEGEVMGLLKKACERKEEFAAKCQTAGQQGLEKS